MGPAGPQGEKGGPLTSATSDAAIYYFHGEHVVAAPQPAYYPSLDEVYFATSDCSGAGYVRFHLFGAVFTYSSYIQDGSSRGSGYYRPAGPGSETQILSTLSVGLHGVAACLPNEDGTDPAYDDGIVPADVPANQVVMLKP